MRAQANWKFWLMVSMSVSGLGCHVDPLEEDELPPSDDGSGYGPSTEYLAAPGNWRPPADVIAAGARAFIPYEGGGPWIGRRGCTDGVLWGTRYFTDRVWNQFRAQVSGFDDYHCRPIGGSTPPETSVHGVGRAVDLFIPLDHGAADNGKGDAVANWLIVNAQAIGVQYIIWDRTEWNGDDGGTKLSTYTGVSPHIDHIHVELNRAGAEGKTPWFSGGGGEPPPFTQPPSSECSVRNDGKLYCLNSANAAMYASTNMASGVVNTLRTTISWFDCWGTGERHVGGNSTWYHTLGDDNGNWGWVPAVNLMTPSEFDADPSAHGLQRCESEPPPPDPDCAVLGDDRLHCQNRGGAPVQAGPQNSASVVNYLRTTTSWFECWGTGDRHAGGNTTWYYTLGDDNGNWGWVAAVNLTTTSTFDSDPGAGGLPRCR